MNFDLLADQASFLAELRRFLDEAFPETAERAFTDGLPGAIPGASFFDDELVDHLDTAHGFTARLHERGYRGVDWPVEFGGLGRSPVEQWLYLEEMAYRRLPSGGPTVRAIGRTLMVHGSEAQKAELLPGILSGRFEFALGYTEPDAGSDLGSLRTAARRSDDGATYVVTGQKVFTTNAQRATHLWLAARTSTELRGSAGVSLFVVPLPHEGVTIVPMPSQSGERTNTTYLDEVVVPAEWMVGEENKGWDVVRTAVAFERIQTMSDIARSVEDLLRWAAGADLDAGQRRDLARLVVDVDQARLLFVRVADRLQRGEVPVAEAAMAKVWSTEVRERVASTGMDLLGPAGALATAASGAAPLDGELEALYRYFPVRKIAGGANPILRDLIGTTELRLPR